MLAEHHQVVLAQGAGRCQRDDLAVAVASGHVRADAEPSEQVRHGAAGDAHHRLGDAGVGDGLALGGQALGCEGGRGEHRRRVRRGGASQVALKAGEGHEEVGEHARALAALAGEEEGDGPSG